MNAHVHQLLHLGTVAQPAVHLRSHSLHIPTASFFMLWSRALAVAASELLTLGSAYDPHTTCPLSRPRSFISESSGRFSRSLCTTSFFMLCSSSFTRLASTLDSLPACMIPRSSSSDDELLPSSSRCSYCMTERDCSNCILLHLLLDRLHTRRK